MSRELEYKIPIILLKQLTPSSTGSINCSQFKSSSSRPQPTVTDTPYDISRVLYKRLRYHRTNLQQPSSSRRFTRFLRPTRTFKFKYSNFQLYQKSRAANPLAPKIRCVKIGRSFSTRIDSLIGVSAVVLISLSSFWAAVPLVTMIAWGVLFSISSVRLSNCAT